MKKVPTEWSYCEGREYGLGWAGAGPQLPDLVEWSNYECWGRKPFQDFADIYIEDTEKMAAKKGEEFDLDAFFRGFVEGVRGFRQVIAESLARENNLVGTQLPNYVPLY